MTENTHLGKLIANGRTADIYAWEAGTVLKLFHDWFILESIELEAKRARAVQAIGLAVPKVGEIIQLNGRNGLIYERIEGQNMFDLLQRKPWRVSTYSRRLAELQVHMHRLEAQPDIPLQRQRLKTKIKHAKQLRPDLQARLLNALNKMAEGNKICHGDFHPGNVLVTSQGEVTVDWFDATIGNPLADVARTTVLFLGGVTGNDKRDSDMDRLVRLFHSTYLGHYFQQQPNSKKEYQQWLPIVAAARLNENIPEVESWLLSEAQKIEEIG